MRPPAAVLASALLALLALPASDARGQRCADDVCVRPVQRGGSHVVRVLNRRAEPVEVTLYFPAFENAVADGAVDRHRIGDWLICEGPARLGP